MPKKILVKESQLTRFLQSFFDAKAKGREDAWMNKLEKSNADVAKVWSDLDKTIDRNIANQYRILKSKGLDTSHLDDMIKKYKISV